jgi:predicted small integral membrane protein
MGARYPVVERKGFLPIATTPGDRLFIGLVFGLAIILLWLAFIGYAMLWFGALLTLVWFVVVCRWG